MKRLYIILACALLSAAPITAVAQGTKNPLETDLGGRVGVTLDKKIAKGLHAFAEAEGRMNGNFSDLSRYEAGAGLSYKVNDFCKFGGGYAYIQNKNSENLWKTRHRLYIDGSLTFRSGDWRFSLKERLQGTHSEVNNPYQTTPNSLAFKSRVKVAYKGLSSLTPYAYAELREVLNDPSADAVWNESANKYSSYSFGGYNDAYINRLRGSIGAEWKLSKKHAIDFFLLSDYCYDKNIDTNAEGTKLKSLTYDQGLNFSLGIGYTFNL